MFATQLLKLVLVVVFCFAHIVLLRKEESAFSASAFVSLRQACFTDGSQRVLRVGQALEVQQQAGPGWLLLNALTKPCGNSPPSSVASEETRSQTL